MAATVKCPTCARDVRWNSEATFRPFCSERCRLIDLGAWASEGYSIAETPDSDALTSDDSSSRAPAPPKH